MSVDRNEQALLLIRVVDQTQRKSVFETDVDLLVGYDVAAADNAIHDVVEARVGPPPFFPSSYQLLVAQKL